MLQVWPIPTLMPLESKIRHIHDPVLLLLKMEGIRLLFARRGVLTRPGREDGHLPFSNE
jgi:hypothetical protein